jgi:integrase
LKSYFYAIPQPALNALASPESPPAAPPALVHQAPRELSVAEVEQLLEIADQSGRILIQLLLSGLSLEEITALHWEQVDLATDTLHVPEASTRPIPLVGLLQAELTAQAAARPAASAPLLQKQGRPLTAAEAQALLARLAHDAGLTDPDEVIPEQLRHTYLAFLVRQGLRLTELGRIAGYVPATVLASYQPLSPPGSGRPLEEIEWLYPALRV